MHVFSVLLVVIGLIALVLSLIPLTAICRHETGYHIGWRAMFALVLVFILGYMFFCHHLIFKTPSLIESILAAIFAGGGLFVVLVSRMTLASLNELQISALEHKKQALHDELTGLPNRKNLMMILNSTIAASGREEASFAIMVMDLNGFKEVNDTLGHQAGDIALQTIAPRLNKQLRQTDTLCRMGGDEFAVILPQTNRKESELVAKKILAACAESMMIDQNKIKLGISIGIALSPENACDCDTLIRYADIAMYQAKKSQLGFEVYREAIDNTSDVPEILQALEDKKLVVYYQPIFTNDSLIGLEVSLRLHKKGSAILIARDSFKSLVDLGASWAFVRYVVDETFSNYSDWISEFGYKFNLRLNLFLGNIDQDELYNYIVAKADQYQIPPESIMIEISELMLPKESIALLMSKLHGKGFKIALDDFGSRGAKLLLLKHPHLDEVKLSCALARTVDSKGFDEALIHSLQSYCDAMKMPLVVPSIGTGMGFSKLKELGIQHFQGDLLCPFISTADMDDWLRQYFQSALDN